VAGAIKTLVLTHKAQKPTARWRFRFMSSAPRDGMESNNSREEESRVDERRSAGLRHETTALSRRPSG
jgi:hypothetical protein